MTIPISEIVKINPEVLDSATIPPVLSGVFMDTNDQIPYHSVLQFPSADAVGEYFGFNSLFYDLANRIYFRGFDNNYTTPSNLIVAPFVLTDSAAFLISNSLAGLTLAELQTFTGDISIMVDGTTRSATINLSAATSFSDAADIIKTAINTPTNLVDVQWRASVSRFYIKSLTTGDLSTISYMTDTGLSTIANDLRLTQAQGAIKSNGRDEMQPIDAINNILLSNVSWVAFMTLFTPIESYQLAFAAAINDLGNEYAYVLHDINPDAIVADSTTCLSFLIKEAEYNNTIIISGDAADAVAQGKTILQVTLDAACFELGFNASIDFTQPNGRTTAAFRSLSGLTPTVTNKTSYDNLINNGYNVYAAYARGENKFDVFYPGSISGIYRFIDSFINQVYLNRQFQLTLMRFLVLNPSIPYNQSGYSSIKVALSDDINNAISFGTIRTGIVLSSLQKQVVVQQAGLDIVNTLFTQGYYLQVLDPGAEARELRKTPIINFWYTDGQSIQQIIMRSINIL